MASFPSVSQTRISFLLNTPQDHLQALEKLLSIPHVSDEHIASEFSAYIANVQFAEDLQLVCPLLEKWQNKEKVLQICTQMISRASEGNLSVDTLLYSTRGQCLLLLGRHQEARDDFKRAWEAWKPCLKGLDTETCLTMIKKLARSLVASYDRNGALAL
ncbi:MAG TPA: tetratricopeptide repeat protein, partial [Candidatus Babeliaceae bacterium]|nr:tetratricopeptide repeat protein [Candidatus Babeliaceae bacterium]